MTALPPPPPPPPPRPDAGGDHLAGPPWRDVGVGTPRDDGSHRGDRAGRRRRGAAVGLTAVVGLVAGAAGVAIGATLVDDGDSQSPLGPSREAVEVAAPRGPIEGRIDVAGVAEVLGPSIVTINADVKDSGVNGVSVGTGVVVTSDGEILTNAHVVDGASTIRVRLAGETEPRRATLLAKDVANDLALLRINAADLPTATFADPDSVHLGDEVIAIGFALDLDGEPSVTTGIVSATDRTMVTPEGDALDGLIQTDAAISSGNSGGPLVNAAGEVVGINTAVFRNDETTAATNIGLAISSGEALRVLDKLRDIADGGTHEEGYLGVSLNDRLDGGQGALITSVESGSPAAEAGIDKNDVVIAVDDTTVDGAGGLIAAIRDREPGEQVTIVLLRDGDRRTVETTLVPRPNED